MIWMLLENLHVGTARQSLGFAAQHLAHLAAVAIRLARAADVYRRDARGSSGGTLSGLFSSWVLCCQLKKLFEGYLRLAMNFCFERNERSICSNLLVFLHWIYQCFRFQFFFKPILGFLCACGRSDPVRCGICWSPLIIAERHAVPLLQVLIYWMRLLEVPLVFSRGKNGVKVYIVIYL